MTKRIAILGMALSAVVASGCNESDVSALGEQAGVQAKKQVDAENESRQRRAAEMEADLAARHRFYQGLQGTYEGVIRSEAGESRMRVILVPSIPPYPVDRVRTLEEIAADLSGLEFHVQVIQWVPGSRVSPIGCRIEGVRPDLRRGRIDVSSESCANWYSMRLSVPGAPEVGLAPGSEGDERASQVAASVAESLLQGRQESVARLVGRVLPSSSALVHEFSVERVGGSAGR